MLNNRAGVLKTKAISSTKTQLKTKAKSETDEDDDAGEPSLLTSFPKKEPLVVEGIGRDQVWVVWAAGLMFFRLSRMELKLKEEELGGFRFMFSW